jgi:uncharacterized protein (DUF169 family)
MELSEIEQQLNFYIRPQYFPVAVKLLARGEKLPEKARFPLRDFGHAIMACQGIGMARRYGWTVAMGKDDIICASAAVGLGFVKKEELHPPQGMSIPFVFNRLKYGKYQYFVVAPIHSATFTPDVIAIYGNSAQLMRLTQAFVYRGKVVDAIATAEADCAEIATTRDSPNPRCILPSGGDRVFGTTQDFEMLFTIPWAKVNDAINGLEYTHKMGIRYPVVAALRYKPEPPEFLDLEKMKTR